MNTGGWIDIWICCFVRVCSDVEYLGGVLEGWN